MTIDALAIWKAEYKKIPTDPTGAIGHLNLAKFVNARVTNKLNVNPGTVTFSPLPVFTWQFLIFDAEILALGAVPSVDPIVPRAKVATAWSTATQASTLIISPGSTMNPPPPGTNGIVKTAVAVLDPDSLTKATNQLTSELQAAQNAPTPDESVFSTAVRNAFLNLTYTITGDDTSGGSGPFPFAFPKTKVV